MAELGAWLANRELCCRKLISPRHLPQRLYPSLSPKEAPEQSSLTMSSHRSEWVRQYASVFRLAARRNGVFGRVEKVREVRSCFMHAMPSRSLNTIQSSRNTYRYSGASTNDHGAAMTQKILNLMLLGCRYPWQSLARDLPFNLGTGDPWVRSTRRQPVLDI